VRLLRTYTEIADLLRETVTEATEREATAFDKLAGHLKDSLVLFGAGNLGRKTLSSLRKIGIEPLAFTDNNQDLWGTIIDGITVYPPLQAANYYRYTAAFVITIWRAGESSRMINFISQLKQLGCKIVIPFNILFWKYPDLCLPYHSIDQPHKVLECKDAILRVNHLWTDDFSRLEYMAQVSWLMHADWYCLSDPIIGDQYFLNNFTYLNDEVFIDCGAYDGDTINNYL
jgi:hypothetical protein